MLITDRVSGRYWPRGRNSCGAKEVNNMAHPLFTPLELVPFSRGVMAFLCGVFRASKEL
jgi:hypothetical protein